MRIHSSVLEPRDFTAAIDRAGLAGKVNVRILEPAGSRKRARAWDVALEGLTSAHRRSRNSGKYGADTSVKAATYDEWGLWLAQLFAVDPSMIAGNYNGREGFDIMTNGKYRVPSEPSTYSHPAVLKAIAEQIASAEMEWRQTSCATCGHDVEGEIGTDDWRDRGNGTTCLPYDGRDEWGERAIVRPPEGTRHTPYLG